MFRKLIPTLALVITISACVSTNQQPELQSAKKLELYSTDINTRLFALEETLLESFTDICHDKESALREQLTLTETRLNNSQNDLKSIKTQCASQSSSLNSSKKDNQKLLLGEVEDVELIDQELTLEARIDTGAETSSLGVYRLLKFERDGKDWVRFALKPSEKATTHEYPVHDNVRIKQQDEDGSEARFEIELDLKLGNNVYRNQLFNLSSRRHFDYQILIGRSFLRDIAIVDVGSKHQLKRK